MDTFDSNELQNKKNKKFHHQVIPEKGLVFVNKTPVKIVQTCDVCQEAFQEGEQLCIHLRNKKAGKSVSKKLTRLKKVEIRENIDKNWKNAREKVNYLRQREAQRLRDWRAAKKRTEPLE